MIRYFFVFTLFVITLHADITIITSLSGIKNTEYYSQNRLAQMDNKQGVILDLENRELTIMLKKEKHYTHGSFDFFHRELALLLEGNEEVLEKKFKNLRKSLNKQGLSDKQIDTMLAQIGINYKKVAEYTSPLTLKKTARSKVSNYPCDRYEIIFEGDPISEVCSSQKVKEYIDKEIDCSVLQEITQRVNSMTKNLPFYFGKSEHNLLQDKGYILESARKSMGMKQISVKTLNISRSKIKANIFKVPAGYTEVTLQELLFKK